LKKDASNNIGISIGGGSPCPCLYVVQVFDRSPAAVDGSIEAGDEITGINGHSVKGMGRTELARNIQGMVGSVRIHYTKLNLDPSLLGSTVDIVMKKVKHRLVEKMQPSTADLLGLSRAILCNDDLVAKLQSLESKGQLYRELSIHLWKLLLQSYQQSTATKKFGEIFVEMANREPSLQSSEAFRSFGQVHVDFDKAFLKTKDVIKNLIEDLKNFLHSVLPDMRGTVKKYANSKFEYLSYCLKVKEMEDEETFFAAIREPLYRVETGNMEYRHAVRLRQMARARFAKLRHDVQVKLELMESKHVEKFVSILQRFVEATEVETTKSKACITQNMVFPIEVDLEALISKSYRIINTDEDNDEDNADVANNANGGVGTSTVGGFTDSLFAADSINTIDDDCLIGNEEDVPLLRH